MYSRSYYKNRENLHVCFNNPSATTGTVAYSRRARNGLDVAYHYDPIFKLNMIMRKRRESTTTTIGRLINQSNRFAPLLLLLLWTGYAMAGTNYRTTKSIVYNRNAQPVNTFLNDPSTGLNLTLTTGTNDTLFISDGDTLLIDNISFDLTNPLLFPNPMIIVIEENDASLEQGGMMLFMGGGSSLALNKYSDLFVSPQNLDGLMYDNGPGKGHGNAFGNPVIYLGETVKLAVRDLPGIIAVGSLGAFLPVEFTSFRAKVQGREVVLEWQTAWEWDNDHFEVQHSRDGQDFTAIGQVKGQGTTVFLQNYRYRHTAPAPGIQYYRLRQVDFDGSFAYSDVVSVNFDQQLPLDFTFTPNPARGQVELSLTQMPEQSLQVLLTNSVGQVQTLRFEALGANLQIDLPAQLPAGLYWLQVYDGREKVSKAIVVQ